ncbi:hypothetical protein TNCV_4402651 [Trichonephila clavipes]|uniref:Uncharacterized protein n=1 Tax=Trichonephila clavipes TaxID=2585209 RepID=A0A8X6SEL1_TRICX|nr:hypothetical protein TNCV_4402651 [Trichonephila clavipes]
MQSKGHTHLDAGRKAQSARRLWTVCLEILLPDTAPSRPSGIVAGDIDCGAAGHGFEYRKKNDVCKCMVPSWYGNTVSSCRVSSPLVRGWWKRKRSGRPLTTPRMFSLKIGVETSKIVLSPVWCLKLMLTIGIKIWSFAAMKFGDPLI